MSEGPALRARVVTLFPDMIRQAASHSILGRAQISGRLKLATIDPRDFTSNRHRTADDYPFGGGAGMVLKPEPLTAAIRAATEGLGEAPVILMAPDGERFTHALALELAALPAFVLVCGHYEGVDERVRETSITRTLSLGDFVLTGGELAALTILDATVRHVPGVLGNAESSERESFSDGLLEHPQYTRPAVFEGRAVPEVLLSGHHARIEQWRRTQALVRTRARRPDLWEKMLPLSKADRKLLEAFDAGSAAAQAVVVTEPVSQPAQPATTAGGSAETKSERETY